jgi:hypothetical protein
VKSVRPLRLRREALVELRAEELHDVAAASGATCPVFECVSAEVGSCFDCITRMCW